MTRNKWAEYRGEYVIEDATAGCLKWGCVPLVVLVFITAMVVTFGSVGGFVAFVLIVGFMFPRGGSK